LARLDGFFRATGRRVSLAYAADSFCAAAAKLGDRALADAVDGHPDFFHSRFGELRELLGIPAKRNGLRHASCSVHFAMHANENLTAAEAGNPPAMTHAHYKGLATKKEAEKWFPLAPVRPGNVIPPATATSAEQPH
jgi:hypothetical protein